jgi:hypothetical protein
MRRIFHITSGVSLAAEISSAVRALSIARGCAGSEQLTRAIANVAIITNPFFISKKFTKFALW